MLPFGMDGGEALVFVVLVVVGWAIPLALAGWALWTLARLRKGQDELLKRFAVLERRLSGS